MSVFLRRLGSNIFWKIGHLCPCRADFVKLIAPKFSTLHCQFLPSTAFVIVTSKNVIDTHR